MAGTWALALLLLARAEAWSFKEFMVGDWDMERQIDGTRKPAPNLAFCLLPLFSQSLTLLSPFR